MSAILKSISTSNLNKMAIQESLDGGADQKPSKTKLVNSISAAINELGSKQITRFLKKDEIQSLYETLNIETEENAKVPNKTVMQKRVAESMTDDLDAFLKNLSKKELSLIVVAAEAKPESDQADLVDQVTSLVETFGSEVFFSRFDVPFLQALMKEMSLKTNGTTSKTSLVRAICDQTDAELRDPVGSQDVVYSKKKLPIAKGIRYQDVFQHYFAGEVREWCRENGLKVYGTKSELIKRVLAYLDGDRENTMSAQPAEKTEKEVKKPTKEVAKKVEKKTTKKAEKPAEKEAEAEVESEEEKTEVVEKVVKPTKKNEKKVESKEEETTEEIVEKPKTKKNEKKSTKKAEKPAEKPSEKESESETETTEAAETSAEKTEEVTKEVETVEEVKKSPKDKKVTKAETKKGSTKEVESKKDEAKPPKKVTKAVK